MPTGTLRTSKLNPTDFIDFLESLIGENIAESEVYARRIISALYFSLFNYWAAKKYYEERKRGKGTYQDRFAYKQFHEELLGRGLDKEVILLYTLRTASDHHIENPTIIDVQNREIAELLCRSKLKVHITIKTLRNAVNSSRRILKLLQE